MKIIVKESPLHGLGVFACIDFAAGDVIERCPYLVIDDDDLQEINRLNDYLFTSPDDKNDYLCVLGCGMIYNHGALPNAEWQIDDDDNRFVCFTAKSVIKTGEEILHDYGSDYWDSRA
jgi:SET domain-containing protein